MKKGFVYKLIHPQTRKALYIGSTIKTLQKRLCEHKSWIKRDTKIPIYTFLKTENIKPRIALIEEIDFVDISELINREDFWIAKFASDGEPILNVFSKPRPPKEIVVKEKIENPLYNKIIKLISEGYSAKEIGELLERSHRTIEAYIEKLKYIHDAKNINNLVAIAFRKNIIQ